MESSFVQFLQRNSIAPAEGMPLIHSTKAYNIKKIQESGKIIARECDVFRGEKLNYFFVGRPAYKYKSNSGESEYWELPACFIFSFETLSDIRRVFPFDSGAFNRKMYPDYINCMDISEFEVSSIPSAPQRIIGAFFGDVRSYFALKAKSRDRFSSEFSLGAFDEEIKALHRLSAERAQSPFDDRRFSVEIQSSSDVDLSTQRPIAVICPDQYFEEKNFRDHVVNKWKALPIGYPIFSLSIENYYGIIYEKVHYLFKNMGVV